MMATDKNADEPIKVGCVVFEYARPELLGVVEEVEWRDERLRTAGQHELADKLAKYRDPIPMVLVRWLNGDSGRVSLNAGPGRNWSSALFLRIADPATALAALVAEMLPPPRPDVVCMTTIVVKTPPCRRTCKVCGGVSPITAMKNIGHYSWVHKTCEGRPLAFYAEGKR